MNWVTFFLQIGHLLFVISFEQSWHKHLWPHGTQTTLISLAKQTLHSWDSPTSFFSCSFFSGWVDSFCLKFTFESPNLCLFISLFLRNPLPSFDFDLGGPLYPLSKLAHLLLFSLNISRSFWAISISCSVTGCLNGQPGFLHLFNLKQYPCPEFYLA